MRGSLCSRVCWSACRWPSCCSACAEAGMPDGTAARRGPGAMQDFDHHVARRSRERRIMLGLTQQQVAELVGVTYQQAHKHDTGANRIGVGRLYVLAEALGVEPGYFFQGPGAD